MVPSRSRLRTVRALYLAEMTRLKNITCPLAGPAPPHPGNNSGILAYPRFALPEPTRMHAMKPVRISSTSLQSR